MGAYIPVIPEFPAAGLVQPVSSLFPGFQESAFPVRLGQMVEVKTKELLPPQQGKDPVFRHNERIPGRKPLAPVLLPALGLYKMLVDEQDIVQVDVIHRRPPGDIQRCLLQAVTGQPIYKEVLRLHRCRQVKIIVEVYEVLAESLDPVHIQLNGMGAEGGEVFLRDVVLMAYDVQPGIIHIQPGRQMSPGDEVDPVDPGRVLLHPPEPVPQQIPLPVTDVPIVGGLLFRGIFPFLCPPCRVTAIHPGDDKINFRCCAHWAPLIFQKNSFPAAAFGTRRLPYPGQSQIPRRRCR